MAIDLIKNTLKYTIILGIIGLILVWAFNLKNSFAETRIINGQEILVFNWYTYANSISNAWSTEALKFDDILPSRTWDDSGSWNNWDPMFNNLALIFDWIYFPLNFSFYLFRWFFWIVRLLLALIGWDFTKIGTGPTDYNSTLIKVLTWCTQNLYIPYI